MDPFKNHKNTKENEPPETVEDAEVLEISEDDLDDETGMVEGRVSEVAHEEASEQAAQSSGKKAQADDKKVVPEADLSDRIALREQLLKAAPAEPAMRAEVKKVLVARKEKLESDVAKHKRKRNYRLLSMAIMELRLVVRQLEELARASYDALKEIWLKVVHRFA
ncbi:hypothetical protein A3J23_01040 [Candidatus Peregrinibacteria bacterium RIFCSPLOWO2_02_FULL_48_14]|nr:MAG: hypothetical protein UY05_C0071G0003 [Candidatus Peregrinibacteria bacterium GW2011_GWA2_47_7]OGJ43552.1 MAG: hypothetical protein A3J23_01040 [Candidatus Peregrinibacteria bacterium RIFCSPLOWO2_02_FULL_48_14]